MAKVVTNVARMRVYAEATAAFATDHSGTAGDFLDCPFVEGTVQLQLLEPMESPQFAQQHLDAYPIEVHMPKRARLSFDIPLTGLGLATSTRGESALSRLLKIFMGGVVLGTSNTVASTSTTTVVNFTSASLFAQGDAVAFATGAGGKLEMREILSISTNAVTLKHALSNAPANGSVIYAAAVHYLTTGQAANETSLQVIFEGIETDDRWLLLGGQIASPPKFSLPIGGIPRISFEWEFANWFYADGVNTAGDFVGPALAAATYTFNRPVVMKDSELRITDVGTSSIASTLIDASTIEFTPAVSYTPHLAPGGTQNIVQWIRTRTVPVITGSFTYPYEDQTWFTEKAEDDRRAFFLQIGSSPTLVTGGGVLISAPTIQITDVQRVDMGGVAGQQVSWKGTIDGATSGTADYEKSAFRIHLF